MTIGENCVIGAGSVVTRDIPAGSFAAGNPARVIRPITAADTVRGRFPGIRGGIKTEGLDNSSRPSQSIEKVFSTDC